MTPGDVVLCSLLRSVLCGSAGLLLVCQLRRRIHWESSLRVRRCWLVAAVLPFFVPELLTGFTYRVAAAKLVHSELATELLYGLLMLIRCVSAGTALMMVPGPSAVSRQALHAWLLLKPDGPGFWWWRGWLWLHICGPWRSAVVSWALMVLICFQEFETAALLQIDRHPFSWTVWLFDAHSARQPLADSFRLIVIPLLAELVLLAVCLPLVMRRDVRQDSEWRPETDDSFPGSRPGVVNLAVSCGWMLLALGTVVIWPLVACLLPLVANPGTPTFQGILLWQSVRQIVVSAGFSVSAAVIALRVAAWLLILRRPWVVLLALLPGLSGSLVLSLSVLAVFQLPVASSLYDTWLPMLAGSTLSVLPRAFVGVLLLSRLADPAALHSATLLLPSTDPDVRRLAGGVIWRLRTRGWFVCALLIVQWAFWDVTVAAMLRPVDLEPVVTRLYNEMHYGRTEMLLVMTLLAILIPGLMSLLAMLVWRILVSRFRYRRRLFPGTVRRRA